MKNTKNIMKLLLLLVITLFYYSCSDETNKLPTDGSVTGIYLREISNTSTNFIVGSLDNSKADITLEVVGADNGNSLKEVQVYIKYIDDELIFTGAEKLFKTIPQSDFVRNPNSGLLRKQFIYSATEMATALNITNASIFDANDKYELRFAAVKNDGKIFTKGSNGADLTSSPGFYQSPFLYTYNLACISNIGGTYAYVTTNCSAPTGETAIGPLTGSVTFSSTATAGLYNISDAAFGGWLGLYGPGNIATGVKLQDVCNKISYNGVDQFGEVFTFSNLVITGNKMKFHWENDYGEKGDTELTNPNGNWPALTL
jgi:hypothetical protein